MDDLFDKIMDNEELTDEEVKIVDQLKNEEIKEEEKEMYQLFEEEDDVIYNFSSKYFKNIRQKNKVLAKIAYRDSQEVEES